MRVTRIKEDITAISYELLRRTGLSVKFKVKTYYEGINKQNMYYYTSYIYNSNNSKKSTINLSPRSYIQLEFGAEDGKNLFFLSELYKNKIVKKLIQVVQLLEAYDSKEIDIVRVDQSGTHISNKFPKETKVTFGSNCISFIVGIRESKLDIGVTIKVNNMCATISMYDFLDLYYKLSGLNYTTMSIALLNHIGPPDMGSHEVDFRPTKIISPESRNSDVDIISGNKSPLDELAVNKPTYNKPKW